MPLNFTRRQWLTLIVMGITDFCNAVCVSLQAPFFPQEAEKKGANATEYGFVFGVFELVVFMISPIYGQYINKIGPKIMFNCGIFTTGTSAILFGLLDRVEDHTMFITLAFTIRIIEALGNAAFLTSSFAIIAKEFPNSVGTTFATLETFFGLGLIVGPMVGGALYQIDGYYLPFVVLGSALFTCAIVTLLILPYHPRQPEEPEQKASMIEVLKIPGVLVCTFGICATSASIGFIGATLEPHLRQFDLNAVQVGVVFIINGGVYAIFAPLVGMLVDRINVPKQISIFGCFCVIIGFSLVGPVSFLPWKSSMHLVVIGLMFHGLGIASLLVSTFSDALQTAMKNGFNEGLETYGLISGLWTSVFAFGAFVGPSVSGFLYDAIGFRKSVLFIIILHSITAVIFIFFTCSTSNRKKAYKEIPATEDIMKKSRTSIGPMEISRASLSRNSSFSQVGVAIERGCGMNNLIMSSSYSGKVNHWQRLEESNMGLLQDHTRDDDFNTYGSIDADNEIHRATLA